MGTYNVNYGGIVGSYIFSLARVVMMHMLLC